VGAFHGNLPHVANIDNQRNSTNLQVPVAMEMLLPNNGDLQAAGGKARDEETTRNAKM
jgi:hypothetical protein